MNAAGAAPPARAENSRAFASHGPRWACDQATGFMMPYRVDGRGLPDAKASRQQTRCHLSPCGRGRIASLDAIRVRGTGLSIDLNPLTPTLSRMGRGGSPSLLRHRANQGQVDY